jgi:hypothetical protein
MSGFAFSLINLSSRADLFTAWPMGKIQVTTVATSYWNQAVASIISFY